MTPLPSLTKFGVPTDFEVRGSVISQRLDGRRLLFLFGERHGIKPGIRDHLLNAIELFNSGLISCVGVEGWVDPADPFPCADMRRIYEEEQKAQGTNVKGLIEGVLKKYPRRNFLFWKLLTLMLPSLRIESVEDQGLFGQADWIEARHRDDRTSAVAKFLRDSGDLFEPEGSHRECRIEAKAAMQVEQQLAELEVHLKRDDKFIEKMLSLWDRAGIDKAAILNAGTSHQYRIARRLHTDEKYIHDVSYILIDQP